MSLMENLSNNADSSARRMLIYLLIDVSGSMDGAPLQAVVEGLDMLNKELRHTPEAVEMVHVCVILFGSNAQILTPIIPITQFSPPTHLTTNGSTNMAAALDLVHKEIDKHFRPNKGGQVRGDYKPAIFLLTDGEPDDLNAAIQGGQRLKNRPSGYTIGTFLALGCGPHVNADNLRQIAKTVAMMHNTTPDNLRSFFQWVSASIASASRRASRAGGADPAPAEAAPIPVNNQGQQAFQIEF